MTAIARDHLLIAAVALAAIALLLTNIPPLERAGSPAGASASFHRATLPALSFPPD